MWFLNQSLEKLKTNDNQVVSVSFDYRVENLALQNIPNVKSVINTFDFEYELTFETKKMICGQQFLTLLMIMALKFLS